MFLLHVQPSMGSMDFPSAVTPEKAWFWPCTQSSSLPRMGAILFLSLVSYELPLCNSLPRLPQQATIDWLVETTELYFLQFWRLDVSSKLVSDKSKLILQGKFLVRALFLACRWPSFHWVLTWQRERKRGEGEGKRTLSTVSCHKEKTLLLLDQGSTLIASFNHRCLHKDPMSYYSHVEDWNFNIWILDIHKLSFY